MSLLVKSCNDDDDDDDDDALCSASKSILNQRECKPERYCLLVARVSTKKQVI